MKFSFSTLIVACLVALASISCSKEEVDPIENIFVAPTVAQFKNLRDLALAQHTETATFNAEDGVTFTSNDGAQINIPAGCLTNNGNPVTGAVELTFIDLYAKNDMMATNKPTMGLMPSGDKALLITGGEFFIDVRQNNTLLESSCGFHLLVPFDNTGGEDSEMIMWTGVIDENGNLTWEENENMELFAQGANYFVFGNEFGWTNIDRFYSDPRPKTTMKVKVPEGFDFENSAVYLSYDGEPNALAQLDAYISETKVFSEHYGQIPIGLEAHIIFATAEGDDWRYAIQAVTISANQIYTFTMQDTQVDTYENLVAAINALP
ncbi:hypothetical protein [Aequorivita sublithincola]|nr:hypothetical protein [Aequorivita sublithincola]